MPSALPFSGAYTRIVIIGHLWEAPPSQDQAKSTGRADTPTPMPYAERNRAARYFFPDKYDVNLSTKFKIGDYEETVPLATLTRVSDQNGEVWLRDLTYNRSSFPWFLVRDRTVPNVLVEFNGSRDYESGIAGAALQVALTGIRMVAPEAGVITTLSANATKDKANAIDRVLGRLFSNKLSERHLSDRDLNKWKPDGGIAVGLNLPIKDGDWNGTLRSVGTWTINFEAPRPSIFSDWYLCTTPAQGQRCKPNFSAAANEVYREKDAATILAYPLIKTSSGSLSIKDHLMQQSWFNNARTSMGGKAEADAFTANQFCADLVDHSVKLGLNASDANLMVWAVIAGIPAPRAMATKAWDAQKCKAAISAVTAL
ncbi:hypothetical protein A9975_16515 [Cupriavidus sp. UME77]|nr:hypothetical protein [Cupriavidus sp. UME77]